MKVIADEQTARRLGTAYAATQSGFDGKALTVFRYEQHRTGLTLFGAEVVTFGPNGPSTKIIVTQ